VVYFAKAPVPGQVKTRLCPPLTTDEAAALYGAFLRRIVRPVSGARTLVYGWPGEQLSVLAAALPAATAGDPGTPELRPQQGADLWERMQRCFAELFAAGHAPVLIRNTDSPDLEIDLLHEALRRCTPGTVVLGPDFGGGYYLVALAQPCPELFADLEVGGDPGSAPGSTILQQTRDRARRLGLEVVELAERRDVDRFEDLIAMWRQRATGAS